MRDYLFSENKNNAFDLQKKFRLDEHDTEFIYHTFWPIIFLKDISQNEFQELLDVEKNEFIKKRKKFVIEIFKRDYLDFLIYELKEYLDNINRGKNKIYDKINDTYFHWFKLSLDTNSYTLLLSNKDITDLEIYFNELLDIIELFINENENKNEAIQPEPIKKSLPELNEALISFSNTEIIENLHNELKGYFQNKEAELKQALQGEELNEFLLFPHNQNKFVEVFKRLKYNGYLLNSPKEIEDWICSTFTYQYKKGNKKEVRNFNPSTVHDILTKDKGEPTKNERICIVDWLPYKSFLTRQSEAEKENI